MPEISFIRTLRIECNPVVHGDMLCSAERLIFQECHRVSNSLFIHPLIKRLEEMPLVERASSRRNRRAPTATWYSILSRARACETNVVFCLAKTIQIADVEAAECIRKPVMSCHSLPSAHTESRCNCADLRWTVRLRCRAPSHLTRYHRRSRMTMPNVPRRTSYANWPSEAK
jgi:hypothetical protein